VLEAHIWPIGNGACISASVPPLVTAKARDQDNREEVPSFPPRPASLDALLDILGVWLALGRDEYLHRWVLTVLFHILRSPNFAAFPGTHLFKGVNLDNLEDVRIQWTTGTRFPNQFATSLSPTCAILSNLSSGSTLKQLILAITIDCGGGTHSGSGSDANWYPLSTILHPGSNRFRNLEVFLTVVRLDVPSLDSQSVPLQSETERFKTRYGELIQRSFAEAFMDFATERSSAEAEEEGGGVDGEGKKFQCKFQFVSEEEAEFKLGLPGPRN
jgi:hypothetical protein